MHLRRLVARGAFRLMLVGALALVACTSKQVIQTGQRPRSGHVFNEITESWGITTSPPGDEWGFQVASLRNTTSDPITLVKASVIGPGVGSVVDVVSIEVTPYPAARGFRNVTRPPVFDDHGMCLVGRLSPVKGYVLQPGAPPVSLFVVMRSAKPGAFRVDGHRIVYEQRGVTYEQVQHEGVSGHVASGVPALKPYPEETACLDQSGVELLPSSAPPPASVTPS